MIILDHQGQMKYLRNVHRCSLVLRSSQKICLSLDAWALFADSLDIHERNENYQDRGTAHVKLVKSFGIAIRSLQI